MHQYLSSPRKPKHSLWCRVGADVPISPSQDTLAGPQLPFWRQKTIMPRLLINIDHIATLRNARRETFPDPAAAAVEVENANADGVVFHLREDRRHITDEDVKRIKEVVRGKLDFELST